MRVYHFLKAHYGIEAIKNRRIKVSRISTLNDPFEYLQYQTDNYFVKRLLQTRKSEINKKWGILCFSKNYTSPVQWAHYADGHQGLCLGFDIPEAHLMHVEYIKERASLKEFQKGLEFEEEEFIKHMLSKKYEHWAYEEECRMLHRLENQNNETLFFADFSPDLELREVIFGARFRGEIKEIKSLLKEFENPVKTFSIQPCKREFKMIRPR
jgi:hypothetical protein